MQVNTTVCLIKDEATGQQKVGAAYLQLKTNKVYKSKSLDMGKVIADYDRRGHLVGVEILQPCNVKVLMQIDASPDVKNAIASSLPLALSAKD